VIGLIHVLTSGQAEICDGGLIYVLTRGHAEICDRVNPCIDKGAARNM
jgi:hypothetical protein